MKLHLYLQARGESVREFAARSGVPRVTVQNIASGLVRCRIDIAKRIVDATKAQRAGRRHVDWADLIP